MARKKRRRAHHSPRPPKIKPRPGVLRRAASRHQQTRLLLIDVALLFSVVAVLISGVVVCAIYSFLNWERLRGIPLWLKIIYTVVGLPILWLMWTEQKKLDTLQDSVPFTHVDFKYVATRRARILLLSTLSSIELLLPALYLSGFVGRLSSLFVHYATGNQVIGKSLAWLATAAMTGVVGNVTTRLLARFFGVILNLKPRKKNI